MMTLAVVALVIPAIFDQVTARRYPGRIETMSLAISFILLATYAASLVFSLRTHRRLFGDVSSEGSSRSGEPSWSLRFIIGWMIASAAAIAVVSELLVHAVDQAGQALGFTARYSWA
jgi:Ca2+:H+ antiporter